MRSAKLRFPLSMSLLVKRATFRLLYLASGPSGRRTALLRLGTICLLINQGTCFVLFSSRKSGVLRGGAPLWRQLNGFFLPAEGAGRRPASLPGFGVSPLFLFPYSPP